MAAARLRRLEHCRVTSAGLCSWLAASRTVGAALQVQGPCCPLPSAPPSSLPAGAHPLLLRDGQWRGAGVGRREPRAGAVGAAGVPHRLLLGYGAAVGVGGRADCICTAAFGTVVWPDGMSSCVSSYEPVCDPQPGPAAVRLPCRHAHADMHWILKVISQGHVRTFTHHRLLLLEQKFNLHVMLNAGESPRCMRPVASPCTLPAVVHQRVSCSRPKPDPSCPVAPWPRCMLLCCIPRCIPRTSGDMSNIMQSLPAAGALQTRSSWPRSRRRTATSTTCARWTPTCTTGKGGADSVARGSKVVVKVLGEPEVLLPAVWLRSRSRSHHACTHPAAPCMSID